MTLTPPTLSKIINRPDPAETPLAKTNRLILQTKETYDDYWTAAANPTTPQDKLRRLEWILNHKTNDLVEHLTRHWPQWRAKLEQSE